MTKELVILGAFASFAVSAATVRTVATESAGEVRLSCSDTAGWVFDLTATKDGGRDVVTVRMRTEQEARPPQFAIDFEASGAGVRHVWSYDWQRDAYHLWPASWTHKSQDSSQLACGIPVAVAFDANDSARLALACSDPFEKVVFSLAAQESAARLCGHLEFFTEAVTPIRSYEVKILIDGRVRFWADAVRDAADWVADTAGLHPAEVPDSAFDPLYSTWYTYWQDVHAGPLEREAELAAKLGMRTMILDDGWQKVASRTFYSATGDWKPVKSRFPDMKAHVDAVHRSGLKYMLWFSVPYVGDESEAWKLFKGKFLYLTEDGVGVLDPRFPEVREHLIGLYERAVRDWGFDGLKLDFIDMFVFSKTDPAVAEGYAGRDIRSLPQAVDRLMKDVLGRLKAIRPDVLIEFRQNYMGPAIRQYGNMIRALDCPADPFSNRKRISDLRLTSGTTPVHSDMIVWSRDETPEGAALPILNAIFGVIQYSVRLAEANPDHLAVIRHWLAFSREHRDTLLKGRFRPHHPESGYPLIEAESGTESVVAVYIPDHVIRVRSMKRPVYLLNATAADSIVVEFPSDGEVEVSDAVGKSYGNVQVRKGLRRLSVPPSGLAVFRECIWSLNEADVLGDCGVHAK